jgi:integrase
MRGHDVLERHDDAVVSAKPIFANQATSQAYIPAAVSMAFQRACQRIRVTGPTLHGLRHTFVTNARRAGIDYFRIMAITGHKILRTVQRYSLVEERNLQKAVTRLDTSTDTSADERSETRRQGLVNPGS